jgi:hypothetical protein
VSQYLCRQAVRSGGLDHELADLFDEPLRVPLSRDELVDVADAAQDGVEVGDAGLALLARDTRPERHDAVAEIERQLLELRPLRRVEGGRGAGEDCESTEDVAVVPDGKGDTGEEAELERLSTPRALRVHGSETSDSGLSPSVGPHRGLAASSHVCPEGSSEVDLFLVSARPGDRAEVCCLTSMTSHHRRQLHFPITPRRCEQGRSLK